MPPASDRPSRENALGTQAVATRWRTLVSSSSRRPFSEACAGHREPRRHGRPRRSGGEDGRPSPASERPGGSSAGSPASTWTRRVLERPVPTRPPRAARRAARRAEPVAGHHEQSAGDTGRRTPDLQAGDAAGPSPLGRLPRHAIVGAIPTLRGVSPRAARDVQGEVSGATWSDSTPQYACYNRQRCGSVLRIPVARQRLRLTGYCTSTAAHNVRASSYSISSQYSSHGAQARCGSIRPPV